METNFDFQIAFMLEAYFWRSKHLLVKMKIPFKWIGPQKISFMLYKPIFGKESFLK